MVRLPVNQVTQDIADLGEMERATRWTNVQASSKKCRKCGEKGLIIAVQFNQSGHGMPLDRIGKHLNPVLVQLWLKLKLEQQPQKLPPKKGPHMDWNQVAPSTPLSAPPF